MNLDSVNFNTLVFVMLNHNSIVISQHVCWVNLNADLWQLKIPLLRIWSRLLDNITKCSDIISTMHNAFRIAMKIVLSWFSVTIFSVTSYDVHRCVDGCICWGCLYTRFSDPLIDGNFIKSSNNDIYTKKKSLSLFFSCCSHESVIHSI